MSDTFWTENRVKNLRYLWAEGMSTREIADAFGISHNAVCGKARRLELPMRRVGSQGRLLAQPIKRPPQDAKGALP